MKNRLLVYHAGSLSLPLEKMTQTFKTVSPPIDIVLKSGGSAHLAQRISVYHELADILVSADARVIDTCLIPDHADWNIHFAANRMVLCYTEKSRYAAAIKPDNWHEVLSREDVVWGHADPDADPCGYRSLMVLQLAEKHYERRGLYETLLARRSQADIRSDARSLLTDLKNGRLDYAWEYLSVAVQQGLKHVALPDEINLGNMAHDPFYSQAAVEVLDKDGHTRTTKKGQSCTYGVTIMKKSKNQAAAEAFLAYLLDPDGGLAILAEMGQPPMVPCRLSSQKTTRSLPESLRKWVTPGQTGV